MQEKLKELALRYEDLQAQLADPSVYGDAERLKTVNRELKDLTPVAEAYQAYRQAEADRAAAEELLSDPEMRELAQEELTAAREEMERLRQELKLLLLPKDPNDRKNVILEIRAGTGGEEAALFAASLLRMYTMYAAARGWRTGLTELLKEEAQKKPFLGICLGMQMLFESSCEFEVTAGLGLIPGKIVRIPDTGLKIPHMGWNQLEINHRCPLLDGVEEKDSVYFVHSYMAQTASENVSAYCDYGVKVPALVRKDRIYGAQFHPEKSGAVGLRMLRNFAAMAQEK